VPEEDRHAWNAAYNKLEAAWRIGWPHVERFECHELEENLKSITISLDESMLYAVADKENEGLLSLALTQWLVEQHNELVQIVAAACDTDVEKKSSRIFEQHDVMDFNGDDLMRFIKSRCVTFGNGGRLVLELALVEEHLRQALWKPSIVLEINHFKWLGEASDSGIELRGVVDQDELGADVLTRLKSELNSPALASQCLQKVQMAVTFILRTGVEGVAVVGSHVAKKLLMEYLRDVLHEDDSSLPSPTARAEVELRHVDAFMAVLKEIMNKDPMDEASPKYKVELPADLRQELLGAATELPIAYMLPALSQFTEAQLVHEYIGPETLMVSTLEYIDALADDHERWTAIQRHMPADLKMKHWCATYTLLKGEAESSRR